MVQSATARAVLLWATVSSTAAVDGDLYWGPKGLAAQPFGVPDSPDIKIEQPPGTATAVPPVAAHTWPTSIVNSFTTAICSGYLLATSPCLVLSPARPRFGRFVWDLTRSTAAGTALGVWLLSLPGVCLCHANCVGLLPKAGCVLLRWLPTAALLVVFVKRWRRIKLGTRGDQKHKGDVESGGSGQSGAGSGISTECIGGWRRSEVVLLAITAGLSISREVAPTVIDQHGVDSVVYGESALVLDLLR